MEHGAFITSRGLVLLTSDEELTELLWFNMWKRRLWPYRELDVGDTLYWYDTTAKAIVSKTTVSDIDRFEYASKPQARKRIHKRFHIDPIDDPYFVDASTHGYCLAYKVLPVEHLNLPKPDDFKFPRGGWLRCSDAQAESWLEQLPKKSEEGGFTQDLREAATKAEEEGYFDPANLEDERQRKMREIVQRRGQPKFRSKLIATYDGRCAVTRCDAASALEAAHITRYLGPESNHVSNGLLLRADIHTLFDLNLIGIDPGTLQVAIGGKLRGTSYEKLDGRELTSPANSSLAPSQDALQQRWETFATE